MVATTSSAPSSTKPIKTYPIKISPDNVKKIKEEAQKSMAKTQAPMSTPTPVKNSSGRSSSKSSGGSSSKTVLTPGVYQSTPTPIQPNTYQSKPANTIQRQNAIAEAEARQGEQNIIFKKDTDKNFITVNVVNAPKAIGPPNAIGSKAGGGFLFMEEEQRGLNYDQSLQDKTYFSQFGAVGRGADAVIQTFVPKVGTKGERVQRGVPVGTREEAFMSTLQGGTLLPVTSNNTWQSNYRQQSESVATIVPSALIANQVIQGYNPTKGKGTFINNQALVGTATKTVNLNKEFQQMIIDNPYQSINEDNLNKQFIARQAPFYQQSKKEARATYNQLPLTVQKDLAGQEFLITAPTKMIQGITAFGPQLFAAYNKGAGVDKTKNQISVGFEGMGNQVSSARLGTPGFVSIGAATVLTFGASAASSAKQGFSLYQGLRASGVTRAGSFNRLAGEGLEFINPIKQNRVTIKSVRSTGQVQVDADVLTTLKTGEINFNKLPNPITQTTSQGNLVTISRRSLVVEEYTPKLFGKPTLSTRTKKIDLFDVRKTDLIENMNVGRSTSINDFAGRTTVTGSRIEKVRTQDLRIGKLGTVEKYNKVIIEQQNIKGFVPTNKIRPGDLNDLNEIMMGAGTLKVKPISRVITYKDVKGFDIVEREGTGFGLGIPGRPRLIRTLDFSSTTGRILTGSGMISEGKAFSIGVSSRNERSLIGLKTRYIQPSKNLFDIKVGDTTKSFGGNLPKPSESRASGMELPKQVQVTQNKLKTVNNAQLLQPSIRLKSNIRQQTSSLNRQIGSSRNAVVSSLGLTSVTATGISNIMASRNMPTKLATFSRSSSMSKIMPVLGTGQPTAQITDIISMQGIGQGSATGNGLTTPVISAPPFIPFILPGFPSLGGYATLKGKKAGRIAPVNIAPSFSAIVTERKMTKALNVSKTLGVTPFQVRGLLVDKKGKAKKGKYFKITNL